MDVGWHPTPAANCTVVHQPLEQSLRNQHSLVVNFRLCHLCPLSICHQWSEANAIRADAIVESTNLVTCRCLDAACVDYTTIAAQSTMHRPPNNQ